MIECRDFLCATRAAEHETTCSGESDLVSALDREQRRDQRPIVAGRARRERDQKGMKIVDRGRADDAIGVYQSELAKAVCRPWW